MSNDRYSGFARTALCAAAVVAIVTAAAPVMAQNTTSAIAGRVTDASGNPVAGATVAILHNDSRSTSNAVTDADGRYAARGLRVGGPYTITIGRGGQTEKREGVFLVLAETLGLDAQLGVPTATVVVTGTALSDRFNRSAMGASTNVSAREIAAYASIQRSLQDVARLDPRLTQTDKDRGEISVAGQNSRYNSITIDGVNISDSFGLEAPRRIRCST